MVYDVIIVGSGIAGTYLATLLDQMDINVLVLEKDKKLKLKDSGIVSAHFKQFIREKAVIKEKIKAMKIISPSDKSFSVQIGGTFAYIIDRRKLISLLRKKTHIRYEKVENIIYSNNVIVETEKNDYEAKIIVGADGANSLVRKIAGLPDQTLCHGIMCITRKKIEDGIKIFLNKYFSPDFFSWSIPQNREYGLMTAIRPFEYFEYFKKKSSLPDGEIYMNPIPIGLTKSYSDKTLLIGDAASQVKPITGGGIIFSFRACHHAAETINYALEKQRFDSRLLKLYEDKWKSDFGGEIRKQLFMRKIYRKMSNKDIDNFFKDFGTHIERAKGYDYDNISSIWRQLCSLLFTQD